MAWTASLGVSVGDATKESHYDQHVANSEYLQTLADVEHNFDVATGTGYHKAITATSITTTGTLAAGATTVTGLLSTTGAGNHIVSTGHVAVGATYAFAFDGTTGHTYMAETSNDIISVFTGGAKALDIDASQNFNFQDGTLTTTGTLAAGATTITSVNLTGTSPLSTTSTYPSFEIVSTSAAGSNDAPRFNFRRSRSGATVASGDSLLSLYVYAHDGTDDATLAAAISAGVTGAVTTNRVPTNLSFATAAGASDNDASTKMTITSTGAVKNPVDNAGFYTGAGDDLRMYSDGTNGRVEAPNAVLVLSGSTVTMGNVGNTETFLSGVENGAVTLYYDNAAKLATTSAGVSVNGETNASAIGAKSTTATGQVAYFNHAAASGNIFGLNITFSGQSPDNNTSWFQSFGDTTVQRAICYSDGDWVNHDGTYGTISDVKFKQDIVPARGYWDDFKALPYVKWRDKGDIAAKGVDAPYRLGLVAQEAELVFPGLVAESPDKLNGGTYKWVKSSIIEGPILARVVQEAQGRIEALEAEVNTLKARLN
jgi:hypothetical protein